MNPRLPYLRNKTSRLTTSPGVYIMRNSESAIIYIGKAKNLRNRVSSYFRENPDHPPKVAAMVSNVFDYDFIVTDSEYEALLLECSLIKRHKPKYNILLKDDKGYKYIRISDDEFPRITTENACRKPGKYLGPYTSGFVAKEAVKEANRAFMLPTCHKVFPRDFRKGRPCLNFHIKNCMGVCRGNISVSEYADIISQAVDFIKNGSAGSVERMEAEMNEAAERLDFEKAAMLRDRINAVKKASEKQKIINSVVDSADVIGAAEYTGGVFISVVVYRGGKLCDKKVFAFDKPDKGEDILAAFMLQYYCGRPDIPKAVILGRIPDEAPLIEELLEKQSGRKIALQVPQKGERLELLRLAINNSAEYAAIKSDRTGREIIALEQLANALGLPEPPRYIEAYDISNLSSESMVAGMVVFEDGRPLKRAYKRFNVKELDTQNDYGSMQEALRRRLAHIVSGEGDEFFTRKPDLILLDGGKGHVRAIEPVLRETGLSIPLFGMVKDSKHRTRAIAASGGEIQISGAKAAFDLVTRIQDEVHRYSVSFMHAQHKKKTYSSPLLGVKGIGEKKAAKLMIKYKTVANLKEASPEELASAAGVSLDIAKELWETIRNI